MKQSIRRYLKSFASFTPFKILVVLTATVLSAFTFHAFAHEGHDKTPGAIAAPHGGIIQGTDHLYLELVNDASGLKLYPITHDMTAIPVKEIKLTATAMVPKKSKKEIVILTPEDDHFSGKYDAKGAHRYSLNVSLTYKGKKEKVTFQVEPQN